MIDRKTPLRTIPLAPMRKMHLAYAPITGPQGSKGSLIGLSCLLGAITVLMVYYKVIGF
jgi:hypothetical protein